MTEQHVKTFLNNLRTGLYNNNKIIAQYSQKEHWAIIQVTVGNLSLGIKAYLNYFGYKVIQVNIETPKPYSVCKDTKCIKSPELYDSVFSFAVEECNTQMLYRELDAIKVFNLNTNASN